MKQLIYLCLCLTLLSCRKEGPPGPAGPEGPAGTAGSSSGEIAGRVSVYDMFGNAIGHEKENVSVSLAGTSFSTTTDTAGRYRLLNIPSGIYTITFSKDSFSTHKQQQLNFVGNGKIFVNSQLLKRPNWKISNISLQMQPPNIANVQFTVTNVNYNGTRQRFFLAAIGKRADIDIQKPETYDCFTNAFWFYESVNQPNFVFSTGTNYPSGTKGYIRFYPAPKGSIYYYDYEYDRSVPCAFGEPYPDAVQFTVP